MSADAHAAGLLVVGGGIAGLRTAEEARSAGYSGTITILSEESVLPYDRPPLSKSILTGKSSLETITLLNAEQYADLRVDVLCGRRATSLDVASNTVHLDDGGDVSYDHLVIATGNSASKLPFATPAGVHTVRSLRDSEALRRALADAREVVVIGAGFLGAEIAASGVESGCAVTLVEAESLPLSRVMGPDVGAAIARLHATNGVQLRCDTSVAGFRGEGTVSGVELADGDILPADVVVVAVGARPNTHWLEGSGLRLDDGVVCDAHGRTNVAGVYAVGDVARWHDPDTGSHARHEDWTTAAAQGRSVGRLVASGEIEDGRASIPYFWSDQFGVKIQLLGSLTSRGLRIVHENPDAGTFAGVYLDDGDRVRGVLTFGEPRVLARCRPLVLTRAHLDDVASVIAAATSPRRVVEPAPATS
ncbi:MAG: FAD/NAD(P)-binding oxidoreductase [Aeromicrobium sp.]